MTAEQAQKTLQQNGRKYTLEEAVKVRDFLYMIAEGYVKMLKELPEEMPTPKRTKK